jgi:tetratricopeptide (TPR) repeat protein
MGVAESPVTLRMLLQRAQLSPERFARLLNRSAAELGLVARIDPKAPYKWLRGAHPREPWPGLAAELLSAQLGCRVGVEELGWRVSPGSVRYVPADCGLEAPWTPAGALAVGAEVVEGSAMDRRIFLTLTGSALTQPALEWLVTADSGELLGRAGRRIPDDHIPAVEEITARLRRMDDQGAGGAVLDLVRSQTRHVLDLLRNYRYEAATGLRLHAVAADLMRLAGWLCFEAGQHPAAQRYWIAALRGAHAAGDRALGANVLGFMSCQAKNLARDGEAVRLAEAALRGCAGASPRVTAILNCRLAEAQAKTQDANGCRASIDRAREALRAAPPDYGQPDWSYWMDEAQLAGQTAACYLYLADWDRAERHYTAAIRRQADPRGRESALRHVRLALVLARKGEPEHACEVAGTAVDLLTDGVDSARCVGHVREVCDALRPYRRLPAV